MPSSGLGPVLVSLIWKQPSGAKPVTKNTTWWPLYDLSLIIYSLRISRQNIKPIKICFWKLTFSLQLNISCFGFILEIVALLNPPFQSSAWGFLSERESDELDDNDVISTYLKIIFLILETPGQQLSLTLILPKESVSFAWRVGKFLDVSFTIGRARD